MKWYSSIESITFEFVKDIQSGNVVMYRNCINYQMQNLHDDNTV